MYDSVTAGECSDSAVSENASRCDAMRKCVPSPRDANTARLFSTAHSTQESACAADCVRYVCVHKTRVKYSDCTLFLVRIFLSDEEIYCIDILLYSTARVLHCTAHVKCEFMRPAGYPLYCKNLMYESVFAHCK